VPVRGAEEHEVKTAERKLAEKWVSEAQDIAIAHEQATSPEDDVRAAKKSERLIERITRRLRPSTVR
jgi:hypothetical protein